MYSSSFIIQRDFSPSCYEDQNDKKEKKIKKAPEQVWPVGAGKGNLFVGIFLLFFSFLRTPRTKLSDFFSDIVKTPPCLSLKKK